MSQRERSLGGARRPCDTFNVTLELVRRGYSEAVIAKLWSGNLVRVWRAVERAQESISAAR